MSLDAHAPTGGTHGRRRDHPHRPGRRHRAGDPGATPRHPLSHPPRPWRARPRHRARPAGGHLRPRSALCALRPPARLRRRVDHVVARFSGQSGADRAARHGSGRGDHGGGRAGGPCPRARPHLARRRRARRHRLLHRRGRRDCHRRAPAPSGTYRDDPGRGKHGQRSGQPGGLSPGRDGRRDRHFLVRTGGRPTRAGGRRRRGGRAGGGLARRPRPAPAA